MPDQPTCKFLIIPQRMCKYLDKHCPYVMDPKACPYKEASEAADKAMDDPQTRDRIETLAAELVSVCWNSNLPSELQLQAAEKALTWLKDDISARGRGQPLCWED